MTAASAGRTPEGGYVDPRGEGSRAAPATPGSYGLAPRGFRLPAATRLGAVRLQVGSLQRSLAFYQGVLGMRQLERDGSRVLLGSPRDAPPRGEGPGADLESQPLVELHERGGAAPAPRRGRLGLFHFAVLLPDRPSLGRFLGHADRLGLGLGAGDHLVSEALYLQDPDGLGIELYVDRPRTSWRRIGRQLEMATDPLDLEGLLAAADGEGWTGMPAGTRIGHLHLHVGDLAAAAAFYSEGLGFDRTVWDYPGALFLAAGGYHHHLGTNLWAGRDARPPAPDEAQLLEWTVELPDAASLGAAAESLARAGFETTRRGTGGALEVSTRDPWGTPLRLSLAAGPRRRAPGAAP